MRHSLLDQGDVRRAAGDILFLERVICLVHRVQYMLYLRPEDSFSSTLNSITMVTLCHVTPCQCHVIALSSRANTVFRESSTLPVI